MRLAASAIAVVAFLGAASAPLAADAGDRRVVLDPNAPPWNAVAKVQTNIGTRCTGVLIAPRIVLTAAHCLYNPLTRALLQAVSLHVLFGFEHDTYRWHRLVARASVGAGFDGTKGGVQVSDWARLTLADSVPGAVPLPLYRGTIATGMKLALAGYNQDRSQLLMGDLGCQILGLARPKEAAAAASGMVFVVHDCAGTRGTSGGPLLTRTNGGGAGGWAVAAVNIAVGPTDNLALAGPFGEIGRQASKP